MNTLVKTASVFLLLFLIFTLMFFYLFEMYNEYEASKRIRQTLDYNKAIQHYISTYQKPEIYEMIKNKTLHKGYFNKKLLSSTFIVNHINLAYLKELEKNDEDINVRIKFASDNPTNLKNKADDLESKTLKLFNSKKLTEYKSTITKDGEDFLFYAIPYEKNTQSCLKCHGNPKDAPSDLINSYGSKYGFNEGLGEIRAIIAIYTPIKRKDQREYMFFYMIEGLIFFILVFIFALIYYYTKTIEAKDKVIVNQSRFSAMGEMVSMIAHQWRQPITGIGMIANNLSLDIELQTIDEETWIKNLKLISIQVEYLSHTIDDFRNFFQPDQKAVSININKVIDECLIIISQAIDESNIEVKTRYEEIKEIPSFRNELMQVFLNLIKNSIDAYNDNEIEKRPLLIETKDYPTMIKVIFSDKAGGINKDTIDKIFEPYFSTKSEKNGTGLGLYMSKMIIEGHLGGEIIVSSQDDTTRFEINLMKGDSDGN